MRKLVDSVPDVLVYAGTERYLGIDYQQRVLSFQENENRLGKILMEIRDVNKLLCDSALSVLSLSSCRRCLYNHGIFITTVAVRHKLIKLNLLHIKTVALLRGKF